ncbi:L-seryl-tRNA(Sec) selenium transferase [Patulibacter americanus]|uniref:L-seryl-tRNA(Sec) selenium transferase n=1 Tax=Patulibacter americanus TaxID=588672 RepID=UPI0003B3374E|nr:L-seryl-tRNA(Sec) selenium transferase [Patulibacter americanus]
MTRPDDDAGATVPGTQTDRAAQADAGRTAALRALPGVDALASRLRATAPDAAAPTAAEAVAAARAALHARRAELLDGAGPPAADASAADPEAALLAAAHAHLRPSLRRVLNGTGVVVHTNLGRAPLAAAAVEAVTASAAGYLNLELDLPTGRRGGRDEHVAALLRELTGAEDALVVNNGAAAVLLAVAALAGNAAPAAGSAARSGPAPVVVSRGQLVEIGGGFRVPDVVAQAGAPLVEVGTTNRTRREDYARAVADGAGVVLRVHPSNFRTVGFVEDTPIEELCTLGVPVVDDIGSGVLATGIPELADEPPIRRSIAAGAALVTFSGDKLLGGPQAGILAGTAEAVGAARRHPLARALRPGRLTTAALAATLALYRDPERALREIPVLAMLTVPDAELQARAARLADACGGVVVEALARVGGGALPLVDLPGPAVAIDPPGGDADGLARALRGHDPPLVARIADGRVLVDPRTLPGDELDAAAAVLRSVLGRG